MFPLGNQNTPQYLFDTLGGDIGLINQAAALTNTVTIEPRGLRPTAADVERGSVIFGSCGLGAQSGASIGPLAGAG